MNPVTILWSGVAGAALTMAVAHGALWLLDRRGFANLAFGTVAAAVAGLAVTELGMMQAVSAGEYGQWVRWFHVPNFLAIVGLVVALSAFMIINLIATFTGINVIKNFRIPTSDTVYTP